MSGLVWVWLGYLGLLSLLSLLGLLSLFSLLGWLGYALGLHYRIKGLRIGNNAGILKWQSIEQRAWGMGQEEKDQTSEVS